MAWPMDSDDDDNARHILLLGHSQHCLRQASAFDADVRYALFNLLQFIG